MCLCYFQKLCFFLKNFVSLCLLRLIQFVFRSIETRESGFLKIRFDLFKLTFKKGFSNFSLSPNWTRLTNKFFCRFPPKFLHGFPLSKLVSLLCLSFCILFHGFMHFFHEIHWVFSELFKLGFLMIQAIFSKFDHWVLFL